jgi:hypothetical protein
MNIWLHRINHEKEISLLLLNTDGKQNMDKEYLSFGWPSLGTKEDIIKDIKQDIKNIEYLGQNDKTHVLNFVKNMKKGDLVLVPNNDEDFSIYELIEDDPIPVADFIIPAGFKDLNGKLLKAKQKENSDKFIRYEDETEINLGFFREVKKVATFLSRDKHVNGKLKEKMRYLGTNLLITDCKKSVEDIIKYFRDKRS